MDYTGAYYKAQVKTLTVEIFISISYTLYNAGKTTLYLYVVIIIITKLTILSSLLLRLIHNKVVKIHMF